MHANWLLIAYRLPAEPSARRLAVWRRLKAMGAVYLQAGACMVPKTLRHVRQLKMLENEIGDAGGESVILETVALDRQQEEKVIARFAADRDDAYAEFIDKCGDFEREVAKEVAASHYTYAELEENEADLQKLQRWLAKIRKLDFYGAGRGDEAASRLAACEAVLDDYARRVFHANGGDG